VIFFHAVLLWQHRSLGSPSRAFLKLRHSSPQLPLRSIRYIPSRLLSWQPVTQEQAASVLNAPNSNVSLKRGGDNDATIRLHARTHP
jgi:hypothetical protein